MNSHLRSFRKNTRRLQQHSKLHYLFHDFNESFHFVWHCHTHGEREGERSRVIRYAKYRYKFRPLVLKFLPTSFIDFVSVLCRPFICLLHKWHHRSRARCVSEFVKLKLLFSITTAFFAIAFACLVLQSLTSDVRCFKL